MSTKIKPNLIPENDEVSISDAYVVYAQQCDLHSNNYQNLKISMEDSGGGFYYIIETERWAINDIDELINVLTDFKNRINP